jgi:hypothetical protein
MCGIAAILSSENKNKPALTGLARDLAILLQVRGTDSTGIAQVTGSFNLEYYKRAVNASDFVELPKAVELLEGASSAYSTIIHCRKRTIGNTSHDAAHPFVLQDKLNLDVFAMVHNGTLTGWTTTKGVSDSAWLADCLYADEKRTLEDLKGAAAMIWTHSVDGVNKFFTNGERPLFYAKIKGYDATVVCSEYGLLYAALVRNGLEIEGKDFKIASKNVLYTVDMLTSGTVNKEIIVPSKFLLGGSREVKNVMPNQSSVFQDENENISYRSSYNQNNHYRGAHYAHKTEHSVLQALKEIKIKHSETKEKKAEISNVTQLMPQDSVPQNITSGVVLPVEKQYLKEMTALEQAEVRAVIDYHDPQHKELYLTISSVKSVKNKGIYIGQTVVMRGITEKSAKFYEERYEDLTIIVTGLQRMPDEKDNLLVSNLTPLLALSSQKIDRRTGLN